MKVDVEEISPIERKLVIEVEPERVKDELDRAYSQLSRQVKIPGFRPGHVPRRILEQRYRENVEDDVVGKVVEKAYYDALSQKKVEAVGNPQVQPGKIAPGQPFRFEARVEVKPVITPKDYDGVQLKKREIAIDEKAVDERIEQMRQRFGRLEPVEGRDVAQSGDYAQVDYDANLDGKPFQGSKGENVTVEVKAGEVVEGNVAALEGVKVGEKKEIDYAFPADYQVEDVKGKTAHFAFTLKGLKKQVTPELNDDFAKEIGGGNTFAELKAKVRKDLEAAKRVEVEREERDELIKSLVEKNPFTAPKAMVDRAIDMMLDGALRQIARSGMDPRQLNLDFNKLREEMRERAEAEVKGTLLFEAIAEKEKIAPGDADVDARIQKLAEEYNQPLHQVKKQFKTPEQREGLRLRLREEKTVEFLRSRAKYS
jgi:trigger factor